jgi:hypothetical protein
VSLPFLLSLMLSYVEPTSCEFVDAGRLGREGVFGDGQPGPIPVNTMRLFKRAPP